MTYIEALDKLTEMCESVMLDYECEVIIEAAGDENSKGALAALKKAWAKASVMIAKAWEFVKNFFAGLLTKLVNRTTKQMYVREDCKLSKCMLDLNKTKKAIVIFQRVMNSNDSDCYVEFTNSVDELLEEVDVKKGTKMGRVGDYLQLSDLISRVAGLALKNINSYETYTEVVKNKQKLHNAAIKLCKTMSSDYNKLTWDLTETKSGRIALRDNITANVEDRYRGGKNMNESVMYDEILNCVDMLLTEAAETDDVEKAREYIEKAQELQDKAIDLISDDDDKEDKKDDDKKSKDDVVVETIDKLIDLAIMTESAEEANTYIKMATELQKDIDDIPEEKPVVDDEYPANVNGGEGLRYDNLEDIKELVDGDEEAMKLLTLDPNSLTID